MFTQLQAWWSCRKLSPYPWWSLRYRSFCTRSTDGRRLALRIFYWDLRKIGAAHGVALFWAGCQLRSRVRLHRGRQETNRAAKDLMQKLDELRTDKKTTTEPG